MAIAQRKRFTAQTAMLCFALLIGGALCLAVRGASADHGLVFGYCQAADDTDYPDCSTIGGYPTGYYVHSTPSVNCCLLPQCANSGGLWQGSTFDSATIDLMTNGFGSWCFDNENLGGSGVCCGSEI